MSTQVNLRVSEISSVPSSEGQTTWDLIIDFPLSPETPATHIVLQDPFQRSHLNNLRRHLEIIPTFYPWRVTDSNRVRETVSFYAIALSRQLGIINEYGFLPGIERIVIEIVVPLESSPTSPAINRLHWETLESPEIWSDKDQLKLVPRYLRRAKKELPEVTVVRTVCRPDKVEPADIHDNEIWEAMQDNQLVVTGGHTTSFTVSERRAVITTDILNISGLRHPDTARYLRNSTRTFHITCFRILLITARKLDVTDSSSRGSASNSNPNLVFPMLLELISELKGKYEVELELVRPGSWIALQQMLEERGPGYFDLVHFDTHGEVDGTSW
jgi:hypothetical protein